MKERLGELLLRAKLITEEQLRKGLEEQKNAADGLAST